MPSRSPSRARALGDRPTLPAGPAARARAVAPEPPDPLPGGSGTLAQQPRERRASSPGAVSVLVVEDNPGDAALLSELLGEAGMRVSCVTSLGEASAQLTAQSYDLVLADLHLPDAAGLDCVRALCPLAGDAPVVVLTGLDDDDLALGAVQHGAQDYLVKGKLDVALLRRTLRHARERKQMMAQLSHLARHDPLTGALNRSALRELLDAALARAARLGARVAVIYVDLDRFKEINDTRGHDAGDRVLREIASRLRGQLRAEEQLARLGGDELAILIGDAPSASALQALAERLLATIAQPIELPGGAARVTASLGVASYPDAAGTADELIQAADGAMYQAKRRGRSGVTVVRSPDRHVVVRSAFEHDLHHALDRGELVLHFQPQFALADEHLVGFEALLRWQRPGAALVPPSEFIPLLEDSGQIVAVGEWVIERACEQLACWRAAGRTGLRVAVNLSAHQFTDSALVGWTRTCLARHGVPARLLELEITESHLMANTAQTSAVLAELRALGVRIAIDDFGTGFSSLAYLNRFPVDCLKIDRSLIEQLPSARNGETITHTIIALGHHLGLDVIAEGVETRAQLESLARAGCDLIQGYLLGRPSEAAALEHSDIWALAAREPATTTRMRPLRSSP